MNNEFNLFDELDEVFIDQEEEFSLEDQSTQIFKHRLEMHPECGDPFHPGCEQCLVRDNSLNWEYTSFDPLYFDL